MKSLVWFNHMIPAYWSLLISFTDTSREPATMREPAKGTMLVCRRSDYLCLFQVNIH